VIVGIESLELSTRPYFSTARCKAKSLSKNKSEEPRPSGSGRQAPLLTGAAPNLALLFADDAATAESILASAQK